jgi:L-aminopeptidase/D-esterase-like protein
MNPMTPNNTLTAVSGIKVGHATDLVGLTGCTVVLCEAGAVGGVDQRGGAPGTRETDLLRPMHLVQKVHGVMLAGGSAFGLAAADGVMRYLAERGVGVKAGPARVPIVPAAILFDLAVGSADARPDAEMGYAACLAASDAAVAQGNVGAGTGCSAGKLLGARHATKTGIGSAAIELGGGLIVAALIAVNPFGDVVDEAGRIIAGTRPLRTGPLRTGPLPTGPLRGEGYADTLVLLRGMTGRLALRIAGATVIGVVATNARLDKEQVNKVAQMAQDGLARTIRPAHTLFDGDTLFALATGRVRASVTLVGAYAAEAVAQAIVRAAQAAVAAGGLPAGADAPG